MNLFNAISVGFKEIWTHKFRSALTMLGIVLGVSSLVAMSALVKGMENGMKDSLVAIGGLEKVRIEEQDIPAAQRHLADQAVGLTIHDVRALQRSAPLIDLATPEMRLGRNTSVARAGKTPDWAHVIGTWPQALEINQHLIEYGRMFNEVDDELARNVCVVGTSIRDQLFGTPEKTGRESVVGEYIQINHQPFRIIGQFQRYESEMDRKLRELEKDQPKETGGVQRRRGWGSGRGNNSWVYNMKNSTIYMPLNTMWIKLKSAGGGTNTVPDPRLAVMNIKVTDVEMLEPALQQARNVLMHTHRGIEDFSFQTQENWSEGITQAIRNQRMSGGFISVIGLLVGGIGIMNIMLASITERIREIGIRKAIGATYTNIFVQILVESVVIAALGGLLGLAASYGIVELLTILSPTENTPVITVQSMGLAFALSACVGVLAGLIPAFKAAKLDPIQALRYE